MIGIGIGIGISVGNSYILPTPSQIVWNDSESWNDSSNWTE